MPSVFETAWAARQGDLIARFSEAEGFLLEPSVAAGSSAQPDENARRVADAVRPTLPIAGIFIAKGSLMHAHGRSMADATTRPVVAETPILIVQLDALSQPILAEDRITRRRTGERFRVTKIVPQQFGRGYVHLAGRS